MTINVPRDGDDPEMGIGPKADVSLPVPDDNENWEPLPGRPGYLRHRITKAITPDPNFKLREPT